MDIIRDTYYKSIVEIPQKKPRGKPRPDPEKIVIYTKYDPRTTSYFYGDVYKEVGDQLLCESLYRLGLEKKWIISTEDPIIFNDSKKQTEYILYLKDRVEELENIIDRIRNV